MAYPWSKLNPWPRKPWGFGSVSFPAEYTYGLILPQRGLRTRAYLPGPKDRMVLGKTKLPYFHVMDFSLTSQESLDGTILPTDNFTMLAIMGTAKLDGEGAAHFRTQSFQLTDTNGNGLKFSSTAVDDANAVGSAMLPLILRCPYPAPNMLAILNRTANVNSEHNAVQIVMYGVKELDATGAPPATNV